MKTRRLSPWRVLLAMLFIAGSSAFGVYAWQEFRIDPAVASNRQWFAPYVDVTATPLFSFEQPGVENHKDVVLSFIVADKKDGCMPTWGGAYSLKEASNALDLDRRIARLRQQGGTIVVSFGGLINNELANSCEDESKLTDAYRSVIDYYDLTTIDLDLENEGLRNQEASVRRAKVIAKLQSERRQAGKPLAVWVTIPTTSQGLNTDGTDAVSTLLSNSVDLAGINIMTMNYNEEGLEDREMSEIAINAAKRAHRQLGILYEQEGMYLNKATLWRKIGLTPMIGQTDIKEEVFTLNDAKILNNFAIENGIGRLSMWSMNRDIECGANYANTSVVSDSCSGVKQDRFAFTVLLGNAYHGSINDSAKSVTVSEERPSEKELLDDPATSPYQIWNDTGVYLHGTKVVWRKNVYQAKWWTKGDIPDNPVLQSYETPWELIGPVLPGEKPVELLTLPKGTYPEWAGETIYQANERVLFDGMPYEAKWWNKGQSPAATTTSPEASPWKQLTQAEIKSILEKRKSAE